MQVGMTVTWQERKMAINVEDNNVAEFSISVAKFSVYFA